MTSRYKVSLWKPGGPGPMHTPLYYRKAGEKAQQGRRKERVKVRKICKREPKEGGTEWESERWRGGREGWAKTSEREREREWAGGFVGVRRHWLVEAGEEPEPSAWYENRQSSVPQPSLRFNSAGKELLFPPKSALSSSPLPLHPSPHPSPPLFYRLTASLRLSNTFKQARWAQWNTPHCLQPSKSP